MLDMGFVPDIETICARLPERRQTLLFSATMPPPIKKLSDRFLSNPKTIEVARPASANVSITQILVPSTARGKRETLRRLLGQADVKNAIVFANRKTTVRELASSLARHGFSVGQIHGDMEQPERLRELDRFKTDAIKILVASDVAARGLDIKGVSHVVNFDIPWHPDDYVHRIGRTGRAGATGVAYSIITDEDADAIAAIEKLMGQTITRQGAKPAAEPQPAKPAPRKAAPKAAKPRPEKTRQPGPKKAVAERRIAEPPMEEEQGWNGPIPDFLHHRASS